MRVWLGAKDDENVRRSPNKLCTVVRDSCTAEDIAYLLSAINHSVTEPLDETDVLGTWAGLRPLVSDAASTRTADMSRRHRVTTSPAGVVVSSGTGNGGNAPGPTSRGSSTSSAGSCWPTAPASSA